MESELIGGRFRLHRLLGSGAMGQVWLTTDERLQRSVAVKVVIPTTNSDQQLGVRLEREARAAAAIQHSNVVRVFDYLEDGDRTLIVMEYVEGETLADKLESGGAMSLEDAVDITAQVCDGLAAAHRAGLVHRDLKPSNVMITEDGVAKVLDFGIAKRTGANEAALTMTGAVIGTPRYMAPEQLRGDPLDPRVDVHATGLLLFEMLTGRSAFSKVNFAELMYQIMNEIPDAALLESRGVPAEIIQILLHATQKRQEDRWPDAKSMADALRVCLYGEVIRGRKTPISAGLRAIIDSGERVMPLSTSTTPVPGVNAISAPIPMLDASRPLIMSTPSVSHPAVTVPTSVTSPSPMPRTETIRAASAPTSRLPLIVGGVVAVAAVIGFVILKGGGDTPAAATTVPPVATAPAADSAAPDTTTAATPISTPTQPPVAAAQPPVSAPVLEPSVTTPPVTPPRNRVVDSAARPTDVAFRSQASRLYGNALQAEWKLNVPEEDDAGSAIRGLRAMFDVRLNAAGQLADVNPVSLSGNGAFDDAAAQVLQTVNAARLGLPKRDAGYSMRVAFSGRRVSIVRVL